MIASARVLASRSATSVTQTHVPHHYQYYYYCATNKATPAAKMTSIRSLSVAVANKPVPFARKLAVLFPGQGSQHVGMAHDIYIKYRAARDVIDEADRAFGGGLKTIMFEGPADALVRTENCQPAVLSHSLAMLRVLQTEFEFDIRRASFVLGHSLGEYTALVAAGALDLAAAVRLVHLRGKAMAASIPSEVGPTAMRALLVKGDDVGAIEQLMERIQVQLPEGQVAQIANINSRKQVVISGTRKGVDYASSIIQARGLAGRGLDLPVSCPFHCDLMAPAAAKMETALKSIVFRKMTPDVIANTFARPYGPPDTIAATLVEQCTKTVHWQRSLQYARDDGVHDWLALGPSKALANLVKKEFPEDNVISVANESELEQHGPRFIITDTKRINLNKRRALAHRNIYLDDEDVDLVNNDDPTLVHASEPLRSSNNRTMPSSKPGAGSGNSSGNGIFDLKATTGNSPVRPHVFT